MERRASGRAIRVTSARAIRVASAREPALAARLPPLGVLPEERTELAARHGRALVWERLAREDDGGVLALGSGAAGAPGAPAFLAGLGPAVWPEWARRAVWCWVRSAGAVMALSGAAIVPGGQRLRHAVRGADGAVLVSPDAADVALSGTCAGGHRREALLPSHGRVACAPHAGVRSTIRFAPPVATDADWRYTAAPLPPIPTRAWGARATLTWGYVADDEAVVRRRAVALP